MCYSAKPITKPTQKIGLSQAIKLVHMAKDCALTSGKCYNCGKPGHYHNEYKELKEESNNGNNMKGIKNQKEKTKIPSGNFVDNEEASLADELVIRMK
ncbi:hypothetical protein VNO78_07366 [Psophocarpus tetragonolobus]|uniref:CCHC-type domain-containing protein n=1 Tax=Psophocarpus tetragonolobus TaxID=3891 RepID=A0AAN9XRM0_PSOTE